MIRIAFVALVLACTPAPATITTTTSTPPPAGASCDAVKPRVESLYRAEGQQREPKRIDEYVSDNTTMIMNDCMKDPAKFAPCLANAPTVAQMEQDCVIRLDDDGTEGEAAK